MMEDHQPPIKEERTTPSPLLLHDERCPSPLLLQHGSEEHQSIPYDDQIDGNKLLNPGKDLKNIKAEDAYVRGDEQIIEDIPTDNHPDDCTRSSEKHVMSDFRTDDWGVTEDTHEEHTIISDVPSAVHSKDLSSDPLDGFQSSDSSQTC
ncbi:uncharacterized protein LOC122934035 isoform X2 [Bufo gargarizans]|uniref:uncharacterized protein LOC122934035 isoform X2 n=1 Tax=Bufo gargarizans TaxID=30331 RepID=UPI001CF13858|nr:uncharacterized protein LOC122934035 isoform X2 [Bufo gargarizans]